MNKPLFDHETTLKALRRAAETAKHGTREEQSGKFLLDPVCAVKLIRLHQRLAPFPLTLLVRLLL